MYRPSCPFGGVHDTEILGTPRSAMTYYRCRKCDGQWERGPGLFCGMNMPTPQTLEQRVSALEKRLDAARDERNP